MQAPVTGADLWKNKGGGLGPPPKTDKNLRARLLFLFRCWRGLSRLDGQALQRQAKKLSYAGIFLPSKPFERRPLFGRYANRYLFVWISDGRAGLEIKGAEGESHDFACATERVTATACLNFRNERNGQIKCEGGGGFTIFLGHTGRREFRRNTEKAAFRPSGKLKVT
jgi:hypothetical protein